MVSREGKNRSHDVIVNDQSDIVGQSTSERRDLESLMPFTILKLKLGLSVNSQKHY